jgi:hypothetical protein
VPALDQFQIHVEVNKENDPDHPLVPVLRLRLQHARA